MSACALGSVNIHSRSSTATTVPGMSDGPASRPTSRWSAVPCPSKVMMTVSSAVAAPSVWTKVHRMASTVVSASPNRIARRPGVESENRVYSAVASRRAPARSRMLGSLCRSTPMKLAKTAIRIPFRTSGRPPDTVREKGRRGNTAPNLCSDISRKIANLTFRADDLRIPGGTTVFPRWGNM